MQQDNVNKKQGEVTLTVQTLEDLWYLQQLVEPGDLVKGKTIRKVKIEGGSERTVAISKKIVKLEITVEKVELTDTQLRVSGPILHGHDDISAGSYHTFGLEPGSKFTLHKPHWLGFHWEKLDEACMPTHAPILIVLHDREKGIFALLKKTGVETLTTITGQVAKKRMEQKTTDFFKEVAKQTKDYMERYNPESVILASPSFFKEYVHKELGDMKDKLVLATVGSVTDNGIKELLHRDEVRQAVAKDRQVQEMKKVNTLMEEIGKEGNASYGMKETKTAAESGAVKELLVSEVLLRKMHDEGTYAELDSMLKLVDKADGKIVIIGKHEAGQKLDGLGGIGALLRFRIN